MAFTAPVEEARKEALKTGKSVDGFTGDVRIFDMTSLEEGDRFKVEFKPEDVIEQPIGTDAQGNPTSAQFIVLQTEKGKVFNLYPGTFTKARRRYNADGTPVTPTVFERNIGSACELYKANGPAIATAMEALNGKTIEVKKAWACHTKRYNSDDFVDATMYELNIVG